MASSLKMKFTPSVAVQDHAVANPLETFVTGKVLLVKDDPSSLFVASLLLESFGYQFDVARSGGEAVEKAQNSFYPVILMDMKMPDIDGVQAVQLIRENERQFAQRCSKIICVTADALVETRQQCLEAGMDDYLSKPYRPHELQDKLSMMLEV